MLRIHLLQNLYTLSDEGTRNEVVDSRAFSDFCGVESSNQIPDGDTIGRFRNSLIENNIHEQFFALVVKTLADRGLILKKGTIVDSTVKNKKGKKIKYKTNRRPSQYKNKSNRSKGQIKRREREKSSEAMYLEVRREQRKGIRFNQKKLARV